MHRWALGVGEPQPLAVDLTRFFFRVISIQVVKTVKAIQMEERAILDLLAVYAVEDPGEETVTVRRAGGAAARALQMPSTPPSQPMHSSDKSSTSRRRQQKQQA